MVPGNRLTCVLLLALMAAGGIAFGQQNEDDREFQSALANYNSGQFSEAAAQLEKLATDLPASFEVHELLGLVYAAQSQDTKAIEHLERAVHLKPTSAAARTNFAASLARQGRYQPA